MPVGARPAPPPGTAKLIYTGILGGHSWATTFWLRLTSSAPAQADLDALALSLANQWGTNLAEYISPAVGLVDTTLVWIPTAGTELISTNATAHSGLSSGTPIHDAAACYVLSWHISAYYRGGHPRTYLPGVETENITNYSDLIAGIQVNLHLGALNFLTGVNALTHGAITQTELGTVSFASGLAWRTPPIFRPYVGISVSPKLGNQRRRIHS